MKPLRRAARLGAHIAAMGALSLAGCALKAPPPPPPGAVISAEAVAPVVPSPLATPQAATGKAPQVVMEPDVTGPINGVYQGRERHADASNLTCPPAQLGLIEVGDGTLLFPYTSNLIYVLAVPPDGKLHEAIGDAVLDGQLFNGDLDFSITTASCKSTFEFSRRSGF